MCGWRGESAVSEENNIKKKRESVRREKKKNILSLGSECVEKLCKTLQSCSESHLNFIRTSFKILNSFSILSYLPRRTLFFPPHTNGNNYTLVFTSSMRADNIPGCKWNMTGPCCSTSHSRWTLLKGSSSFLLWALTVYKSFFCASVCSATLMLCGNVLQAQRRWF